MDRRQLVIDMLNHKEREILPYQLDLTEKVRERLVKYYDDPDFDRKVGNSLAVETNESFTELGNNRVRDMYGVTWNREQEGDFGIVQNYLLTEPKLDGYTFPEPDEKLIREKCRRLVEENQGLFKMYAIGFSLFERAWTLRGMENLLMDFILNPEFVKDLMANIVEYNLGVMEIAMEYPIDAVFFGDDWGQQKGMIMGPDYWREYIKPGLREMYGRAKENGFYIAQHSCGDIQEVFPDLVEIGLDIYNTFQPEIFDVQRIKEQYGDYLTFYGGISTQQLLPKATPEKVEAETKRLMEIIGKDGGYIVAPTHAIPNDVPTENILAFLNAVQYQ